MKKIYSLALAGIALFGTITAQQNPFETNGGRQKAVLAPNAKVPYSKVVGAVNSNNNAASKTSAIWRRQVEPIGDIMTNKGLLLDGSASANQDLFLSAIFMDSTVRISSPTSTRNISDILTGTVLDLKSSLLDATFTPIVNSTEGFSIDTVFIPGSYVKVTPATDTLMVWLAWGDTTMTTGATPVWTKSTTASYWVAPLSSWRTNVIGSRVTGAIGAPGNKVKSNAPVANRMLVKYVLTAADSVSTSGRFKYITIPLPTAASIPANNLVNCFFTFVPGATYTAGDCIYNFTGSAVTQNKNGMAYIVWGQTNPVVTQLSDYIDQQVDLDGYNMGSTYGKSQRHASYPAQYRTNLFGDVASAPAIVYSVFGGTSGITKNVTENVLLSQNMPNPFTKESTIRFTLAKDVSSALFTVTDVMGRVVTSEKVATTTGTHSVKLNSYAAGVYYYSINIDGNITTKKMIVE